MINKKQKELLLEQLRKTPIVHIATEKTGIGRATYYRWRKEDLEFAKEADKAITDGSLFINDLAESQLISAIKDKNLTAISLWLRTHHQAYASKVELSGRLEIDNEPLTEEQQALIKKALELAGLNPNNQKNEQPN